MPRNLSHISDSDLVEGSRNGNSPGYFEELYRRYYDRVLDKCYSMVKNREVAEEMTEDVFSRVFEKLPGFRQNHAFSSWIYTITYNMCIDYLREKKRMHYPQWNREQEMPDIHDIPDDPAEEINYEGLMEVLEMIHPEEKALLLMKYQDDLSMKQIGNALRISEDAAKMRLKRARMRLLYMYNSKYQKDN